MLKKFKCGRPLPLGDDTFQNQSVKRLFLHTILKLLFSILLLS